MHKCLPWLVVFKLGFSGTLGPCDLASDPWGKGGAPRGQDHPVPRQSGLFHARQFCIRCLEMVVQHMRRMENPWCKSTVRVTKERTARLLEGPVPPPPQYNIVRAAVVTSFYVYTDDLGTLKQCIFWIIKSFILCRRALVSSLFYSCGYLKMGVHNWNIHIIRKFPSALISR